MNREDARDEYSNSSDLIIKIRDDKDKVYYNGIKAFEIDKNGIITIANNILNLNRASIINIRDEFGNVNHEDIDFRIINTFYESRKLLQKSYIDESSKIIINVVLNSFKKDNNILNQIKNDLKKYGLDGLSLYSTLDDLNNELLIKASNYLNDEGEKKFQIELKFNKNDVELINAISNDEINRFELDNKKCLVSTIIEYIFLKNMIFKKDYTYDKLSGFAKPSFVTSHEKFIFSLSNIKDTIDGYIEAVSRKDEISEKYYQHKFMINPIDFFKNLEPFEEEYYTYEQDEDDTKPDNQKRGRIDCIFLDLQEQANDVVVVNGIHLVELKINETVILDPHGIPTHLDDIENLMSNDFDFFGVLETRIKKSLSYKNKLSGKNIIFNPDYKIEFDTVIGYQTGHLDKCIDKLNILKEDNKVVSMVKKQDDGCIRKIFIHEYLDDSSKVKLLDITDAFINKDIDLEKVINDGNNSSWV